MARQAAPHSTAPIWLMTGTRRFRSLCKRTGFGAACGTLGEVGGGAAGPAAGGVIGSAIGGSAIGGAACLRAAGAAAGGVTGATGILHGARSVAVRAGSCSRATSIPKAIVVIAVRRSLC